ncbi:AlpA family transcriptional regulator [Vibrio sp. PID23_8]|uniref:helix-turn-helix transcriptional regulator n=1 Tax=Vibrio sp. PID23_8 TaxID=1583767 RepID=UPI000E680A76|nr:AlpA family transcriptional regulator [Vibrio sp. PID23_8]RIZ54591.1 hypothetical protein AK966_09220 [Vibrio sp. PID23_8]
MKLENRFVLRPEVESFTGKSKTWIYAQIKAGTFPKPIQLGGRSVAWLKSELEEWQVQRVAERDLEVGNGN